jgi:hypothetical protein
MSDPVASVPVTQVETPASLATAEAVPVEPAVSAASAEARVDGVAAHHGQPEAAAADGGAMATLTTAESAGTTSSATHAALPPSSEHEPKGEKSEGGDIPALALVGRVAWLSVALALGLELLLVVLGIAGGDTSGAAPFVVDAVQKVAWSFLLCASLAVGLVLSHAHPTVSAIAGLILAPVASLVSHSAVEVAHALAFIGGATGPSPYLIAALRGLEYASLGLLAAWLLNRLWSGAHHFAAAGLAVGVIFGLLVLYLGALPALPILGLLPILRWAVNELLFPIGCALILHHVTDLPASGAGEG